MVSRPSYHIRVEDSAGAFLGFAGFYIDPQSFVQKITGRSILSSLSYALNLKS